MLEDLQKKDKKSTSSSSKSTSYPAKQNSSVAAVIEASDASVAVVLPADTSGSSDGDSVSIAPLRVPHVCWTCSLSHNSSHADTSVNSLIDCGSFLVLIHPSLVSCLSLPVCSLLNPEHVSLALKGSNDRTVTTLPTYALINPSTLDGHWVSRTCKAVICPGLCCDLILGLPFLLHNHIVLDVRMNTAIASDCNFDILSSTNLDPNSHHISSDDDGHYLNLGEFNGLCALLIPDKCAVSPRQVDPIRNVKTKLQAIALKEDLVALHENFMSDYSHLFKPVPHTSSLPNEVYCNIELLDPLKKMTSRTYTCPRKFRDAWKTVI